MPCGAVEPGRSPCPDRDPALRHGVGAVIPHSVSHGLSLALRVQSHLRAFGLLEPHAGAKACQDLVQGWLAEDL